jgi:hypothetical protein
LAAVLAEPDLKDKGENVRQAPPVIGAIVLTLGILLVRPGICATEPPKVATSGAATTEPAGTDADDAQAAELAKQLQNPVAALIQVPFQANEDFNIGPDNGNRFTLNIQPVIPIPSARIGT